MRSERTYLVITCSAVVLIAALFQYYNVKTETLTKSSGSPIADKRNSLTAGQRGPILLQDSVFLDEMAHFDRERIPERVVHAKGAGAFGYFEVTHDITKYSRAKVFSEVGKRTPIAVRFSLFTGEHGTADTIRDVRGFAVKFYTEDGNWDLVGNDSPLQFVQDAMLFPSVVHALKRNPVSNLPDADMLWDFLSLLPESTHQVVYVFSDRGIPDGYRHMHGFGANTFKLVNANNEAVYCKFHYKTNQGIKNLFADQATELAGTDPDYATRDLYNAIARGDYPSWTFYIQVMTFEQAKNFRFNPFDVTKVWPQLEFPLIEVGKLVLNRNPKNYFAEVEQAAYTVSNLVPGIEPSPDKNLQGRLFAYADTQRYRLGANVMLLPVNYPSGSPPHNYERDGQDLCKIQVVAPNYYPNSFGGPVADPSVRSPPIQISGDADRYDDSEEDYFTQPGIFYREVLDEDEKIRLVNNIVDSLKDAQDFIQDRAVSNFYQADLDFGQRVRERLDVFRAGAKK